MKTCDILIVEDDENALDTWKRDILEFNRSENQPFKYDPIYASNRNDALKILSKVRINCAVVDLRLPQTGEIADLANNATGNDVLTQLLVEVGVPAIVYSGYPNEVSDEVKLSNIKVVQKTGGGGAQILEDFASQAGLMSAMQEVRVRISKETAMLFNRSIWNRWKNSWRNDDQGVTAGIIARQTASHIADSMSLAPSSYHPDEFYIIPALYADRFDTGDIFKIDDAIQVVMTPRCNMENAIPQHILLCVCKPVPNWDEIGALLQGDQKKKESANKKLNALATQGFATSSHFLPPCNGQGPWLVDFQELRSLPTERLKKLLANRLASVAPHFVPNLVQRYAAYLGRIGQPNIDVNALGLMCGAKPN
ncbi:ActR/RegA family two-component response regulator [Variovorax sp. GrIS 2.14]|uniref:hypothetical protein n=1 Tax=Variovorax sp. GrIS 2.14 TaxID=3071709 RepID=UPI0038F71067